MNPDAVAESVLKLTKTSSRKETFEEKNTLQMLIIIFCQQNGTAFYYNYTTEQAAVNFPLHWFCYHIPCNIYLVIKQNDLYSNYLSALKTDFNLALISAHFALLTKHKHYILPHN